MWALGLLPGAGGYLVHRWNGTDWEPGDRGGVRVAVSPSGEPAVVTVLGGLSVRSGGIWTDLPGLFTTSRSGRMDRCGRWGPLPWTGPNQLLRWTGAGWAVKPVVAMRLAVGPDGEPAVVNPAGLVYQRTAGNWLPVPGLYRDVELGSDGTLYAVGIDDTLHAFSALGQYVVAGHSRGRRLADGHVAGNPLG